MIEVTRLNGISILLNSDLIKTAEASPDTMLTLINGEKLIVREDLSQIVDRVLAYRAQLLAQTAQSFEPGDQLRRCASIAGLIFPEENPSQLPEIRRPKSPDIPPNSQSEK